MRIQLTALTLLLLSLTSGCATVHESAPLRKPNQEAPAISQTPSDIAAPSAIALVGSPDELTVISWNIKRMGRVKLDISAAADLLTRADLITFQEVNRADTGQVALTKIAARIAADSQTKMCWALSEYPTGERFERYAYIWRNDRIAYVRTDGVVVEDCPNSALTIPLGAKNAEAIVREPAVGTFLFKFSRSRFVLASIHLVPTAKRPETEVEPLFSTFSETRLPVIVAGDYNLDSQVSAFSAAENLGFRPAMKGVKTSLKKSLRELNEAYDNFWYRDVKLVRRSVLNLYDAFPARDKTDIYNNISDHSPIQATFLLPPAR